MTAAPVLSGPLTAAGVAIDLRDLNAAYGERVILRDLTLSVAPGERVALVGASGGGKTTLLRALAGLTPTRGTLRIGSGAPVRTRVMFQEDRLLPWLGALGNVALGLPRPDRFRAARALQDVGLAGRERAYPHELSGGQRQRVALARALAHRPDLLLLDEPFGALDALTRADMHALLDTLLTDTGATTLLVTHDLEEALKLTDRVLLLADGRIVEDLRVPLPHPRRRADVEDLRTHLELLLH
ncbi:ABC transporter ATP-binding protein [Deinococcus soli (ex Cha et al. 2016)]|uniref:Sulfonate transport system ATP-binding protein n=2 Tax=Deinococcus soli (ex Cha et al. 2016) TaxID=1309411 RepID=A0AAE3XCE0_9DEIO|nr:ABC transporter ATP-binding protein [Deinococcus soli (ex Cha et al. 2016)]MDR6217892.1 sulfonate transport system ATP-binding protein [Deinococcus soli (ex Cha et al. 2016)]MDR6328142.1 sulfonate transport system ATP-binding protein [Deinococcus soli (ex Cha et al. 2016)]MDR6750994.1 sulfonate transport system ATP-binding protein [Deinococcus soli (ex Cha et al. 2016)]